MTGAAKDAAFSKHCCTLASLGRYAALDVKTAPYPVAPLGARLGAPAASLGVTAKDAAKDADSPKDAAKDATLRNLQTLFYTHFLPKDARMQRALEKVSRAACEVMARYELGQFSPRVRARLADIFRKDQPDALERIETAAAHLGVTGEHADALLDELIAAETRAIKPHSAESGAQVGGEHGNP